MLLMVVIVVVMLFGFVVFFGAPYVPSKKGDVKVALTDLYSLGATDTLVDIGSGDGIVLREAAQRGARAVGYEINPILVLLSRILSRHNPKVIVKFASFWRAAMPPDTTVVYTFGSSRDIKKMFDKVQTTATSLRRPLHFISYAIEVPDNTPLRRVGPHYLYLVEPLQAGKAQV